MTLAQARRIEMVPNFPPHQFDLLARGIEGHGRGKLLGHRNFVAIANEVGRAELRAIEHQAND
jgi:hypothetical protein